MKPRQVLVNGRARAWVHAMDRGLHYGDGLFETIAAPGGRPRLLDAHLDRLALGCSRLGIEAPDRALLEAEVIQVAGSSDAVVKLILTRGPAGRGYRPPKKAEPTRLLAAFEAPVFSDGPPLRVRTCRTRLGRNPALAGLKHLCRLEQVLARGEWHDESIAEGLMLDDCGNVICGTQSNLFVALDGVLVTPRVDRCGVAGVMRRTVIEWADTEGIDVRQSEVDSARLARASEMFLTNAVTGARAVHALDGKPVPAGTLAARFMEWLGQA